MKKILLISVVFSLCTDLLAQSPQTGSLMNTTEANRLNGTVQTKMKDGKPYSQWVAEEKAKKQAGENKVAAVQNAGLVTINATDAKPAPTKVQPSAPKSDENIKQAPVVTEQAVVEAKQPAKEAAQPSPFASGTVASKPAPVAPVATEEKSPASSNSANGGTEKPAPVVAPKTKSDQIPDAPVQTKQGN